MRRFDTRRSTTFVASLVAFAFGAASVEPAAAQVPWDAPFFVPPRGAPGWGVALLDPAAGDLGVVGSWRSATGTVGLRGGLAEENDNDLAALAGIDFSGSLTRSSPDFPFDLDWIAGAGLGAGNEVLISIPFGITMGAAFSAETVAFGPYLSPRLILDAWTGRHSPENRPNRRRGSLDLQLAVDLGFDVAFDPGWTLRFGATLGDRDALALGFVVH